MVKKGEDFYCAYKNCHNNTRELKKYKLFSVFEGSWKVNDIIDSDIIDH